MNGRREAEMGLDLASRRAEIAALCARFHVARLDVFGSAARGSEFDDASSDVDFLVEYHPDHTPPNFADYLALRESLAATLGRPVDLVMLASVRNPFIRASIERSRRPIYGT